MDRIDTDDEDGAGVSLWEQGKKNLSICSNIAAASFGTAPLPLHDFSGTFSGNQETLLIRQNCSSLYGLKTMRLFSSYKLIFIINNGEFM